MIDFLRAHPWLVAGIAFALLLVGGYLLHRAAKSEPPRSLEDMEGGR